MAKQITSNTKKAVKERAFGYCEYCYSPSGFSPATFHCEHITPSSKKGLDLHINLALACGGCNGHKSDKTHHYDPLGGKWVALFHPRNDFWPDHFQWNADATLIIGGTPSGRATVDLLKVNREENINLRSLLIMAGFHPPTQYPPN